MKLRLTELIQKAGLKHYSKAISKDAVLYAWVMGQTSDLPTEISMAERVYLILNTDVSRICPNGNAKTFNTLVKGYRFCSNSCECRRKEQSRKISTQQRAVSDEERQRRLEKQKQTLIDRHGVDNPMLLPEVIEKIKNTNRERYGSDWYVTSEEGMQRTSQTNMEKYGAPTPFQSAEIQTKTKETLIQNHGSLEAAMRIARDRFADQNNGLNPFQVDEIAEKARQTMVERHGVENALASPVILNKMKQNLIKKYGVDHVMKIDSVRESMRENNNKKYNRDYVNQSHISIETINLLNNDREAFVTFATAKSLRQISLDLGVSYKTVQRSYEKYGIPIPKSSYEKSLYEWLLSKGFDEGDILVNRRGMLDGIEIDLFIKSKNVGIEICGLYWHREEIRDRGYHLEKLERANKAGIRLITVFEDELVFHNDAVMRRLANILGISERGYGARSLAVKDIEPKLAKEFLDNNHLQGFGKYGGHYVGAFSKQGELVAVMTFCAARGGVNRKEGFELLRYATDGRNHPGVASKLFKFFIETRKPDMVYSFADKRWSNGELYGALGFDWVRDSKPGYDYIHKNSPLKRERREGFQKKALLRDHPEFTSSMTEYQIMTALGYYRIFDCGSKVYEWYSR